MFYNLDMEDAKRVVDAIASFDGFNRRRGEL